MIEEAKKNQITPLRYLFGGLSKHPGAIFVAVILSTLSTVLLTLPSVLLGLAVDELEAEGAVTSLLVTYVWMIVVSILVYMVLFFIVNYVWAVVGHRWERDARQEFIEILQENSMTFHDEVDSKRLLSVAMQDIFWIRFSLNPALPDIVSAIASFGVTGFFLAMIDMEVAGSPLPIFSLIILIGTPVYLISAYSFANRIESIRRVRSETMEEITSISQGVFSGIEVVRAFGSEEREKEKFRTTAEKYEKMVTREGRLSAFYIPAVILIAMTTIAFLYGGVAVADSVLSKGSFVTVLTLLISLTGLNFHLPNVLLSLRGGMINAERVVKILNWQDPMIEPEISSKVDWTSDIIFNDVSFRYSNNENGDHYALRNLSMTIPSGSRVALIGGPGSGKSTLLKLLMRLYDPTEGTIEIGDIVLKSVATKDVRNAVGNVEQDIFLFRMSVRENIAFGHPDASDEEVETAAKRSQAHDFIMDLPNGYDSMVGERGTTLSGGQRQRLAIARALIQDPKILLLDDAVSAIDAKTEFEMRRALDEALRGRTSITVTQRLRTLIESDLVIILDKGRLIAMGSHDELIQTSREYRRIFSRLPGADPILKSAAIGGTQ